MRNKLSLATIPALANESGELLPTQAAAVEHYLAERYKCAPVVARCNFITNEIYVLLDKNNGKRKPPRAVVEYFFTENDWPRLARLLGPATAIVRLQYHDFEVAELGACFLIA